MRPSNSGLLRLGILSLLSKDGGADWVTPTRMCASLLCSAFGSSAAPSFPILSSKQYSGKGEGAKAGLTFFEVGTDS